MTDETHAEEHDPGGAPDPNEGHERYGGRLLVVAALLGMMQLLQLLQTESLGAAAPLTLAAIGFVVLAAFAVAEALARLSLPKVTGYILSGLVLGPDLLNVLSEDVVEEMGMFKTLAVGLIALTAGLELEIKALAKLAKTLLTTVGAKILIAAPLVGAALIGVEMTLHPLGLEDSAGIFALGLVFAALSIGTSPAIALAIVSESGAKGRLSELVLGAAVLKDLVVVVVLAVAIAAGKATMDGGSGGGIEAEVILHVGKELGLSVLAGIVVGLLLIAYLRWIQAEMLLFVAAIVLVVAELAEALHLELLLICIVAGFLVRNFSDHEQELHHPLEMVSLPIFVVFFTNAGAEIEVSAMGRVLPVAIVLFLVRAGSYWIAAKVGNRVGKEPPAVDDNAWYAYLPQAGVTLGLVGLAAEQLGALESDIMSLGMAVVALNLLVGPLTLRRALERAGELPKRPEARADETRDESKLETEAEDEAAVPLDPLTPELDARLEQLHDEIAAQLRPGIRALVEPWVALRRRALAPLDPRSAGELSALAENPPRSDAVALANALAALYEQAANYPQRLELKFFVPIEERWLVPDEHDSPARKIRRALRRMATRVSRRARTREIPMRLVAREAFEPRLATGMLELFRASCRTDARLADALRRRLEGRLDPEDLPGALDEILDNFEARASATAEGMLQAGSRRMRRLMARIDSPSLRRSELDFSEAAAGIERELEALLSESEQWPEIIESCWQTVEVTGRIRRLDQRIGDSHSGARDLRRAKEAITEELDAFARRLSALREDIQAAEELDEEELSAISTRARALLPKPASKRLRQAEHRLRRLGDTRAIHQALREAASRDTGPKALVGPELLMAAPIPAAVRVRELDVHELIDGEIAGRVLPETERQIEEAAKLVADTQQAATAMVADVELLTEVYRTRETNDATIESFRAGLERVQGRCAELQEHAVEVLERAASSIETEFEDLGDRLARALHEATSTSDPTRWVSRRTDRARRRAGRELERLRKRGEALWTQVREQAQALATSLTRDYRLRSGLSLPSAAAIAKMIEADNELPVTREYGALFTDQPIRDPRFFVANREILREVTRAERAWFQSRTGNAVLIVGGPGSGKTSLLNVLSLKLGTREILWLPEERRAIVSALASELRCDDDLDSVTRRLTDRQRVIVIDDLGHRLPLSSTSIDEVETLLRLIAQTREKTFWVVAVSAELQRVLARRWPLRVGFSEQLELPPLEGETLASVILARHRISHLELAFTSSRMRRLITRLARSEGAGQQRRFFASLARECGGNLRAALIEWCRAGKIEGDVLMLSPTVSTRALPFLRQLPATAIATLALILRFGPAERESLAAALLREPYELERWIHFLVTAQLLVRDERGRLDCPPAVRDVVIPELRELAVFHARGRS